MTDRRPLLIFPCNGNGLEALACLGERWQCIGFVDDTAEKHGREVQGHRVFDRSILRARLDAAVLAVPGSPTSYRGRRAVIESLGVPVERFAQVIHPRASVAPHAVLGTNVLVMAGVVTNAVVGDHTMLLANAVLMHDAVVRAWSIIGANVTIAGDTTIGENCYIGGGASVMNGLSVGDGALVGMGSVVIRDVAAGSRVVGNPARVLPG